MEEQRKKDEVILILCCSLSKINKGPNIIYQFAIRNIKFKNSKINAVKHKN